MGLFGSKKTYVSSTVQNMAGDELDRPDYLKTTVIGSVLADQEGIADTIQRAYLKGPGMKLRSFFRWSQREDNYENVGIPSAKIGYNLALDGETIAGEIPGSTGETIVQISEVGKADYAYWAEQWILENDKTQFNTEWSADYNETTNEIIITYDDNSIITFTPTDFDKTKTYLYVAYADEDDIDSDPHIFIYQAGSGNAVLDVIINDNDVEFEGEFFPFIPIRMDNEFLSETYLPDAYAEAKKAFKKSVDGKIDKVIADLDESENIDDIDFAYAVFGVSVNVLERDCREYLYRFFEQLMLVQSTTASDYEDWQTEYGNFESSFADWVAWKQGQLGPLPPPDLAPPVTGYPALGMSRIVIENNGTMPNGYTVEISWQNITETTGTGLGKPGAKKNDIWFEVVGLDTYDPVIFFEGEAVPVTDRKIEHIRLFWQTEDDAWKSLNITGMLHKNFVYKGKYVEITLGEGLDDAEDSGFIVPLHYPTLREMTLVDSTQMATACTFLVFNSYVVKKTGLLGSLFFKIFLIVVIIAVIVFAPQLAPALAQAAAATGSALGLTGVTALIVGAAVNAIAAMVITSLVMKASIAVFGKKLGLIIGTLISIIGMNGLSNLANGQGLVVNFGNMMTAQNIMMLTSTVGNVYSKFVMLKAMDIAQDTQQLVEDYESESKRIKELYVQNFGYGNGVINPLQLLESSEFFTEQSDTFLVRTLMTGSDIAEMSMEMLGEFANITLSNELPLS